MPGEASYSTEIIRTRSEPMGLIVWNHLCCAPTKCQQIQGNNAVHTALWLSNMGCPWGPRVESVTKRRQHIGMGTQGYNQKKGAYKHANNHAHWNLCQCKQQHAINKATHTLKKNMLQQLSHLHASFQAIAKHAATDQLATSALQPYAVNFPTTKPYTCCDLAPALQPAQLSK